MSMTTKIESRTRSFAKRIGIFSSSSSGSTFSPIVVAVGLFVALVYPFFLGPSSEGVLGILVIYFIWIILAESWNLVGGYAGLINLGLVSFFGLGSVVTSVVLYAGFGLPIAILASALAGAVFALILTPTFRLRTDYFAIATLVIPIVLKPIVEYEAKHSNFEWPSGLVINGVTFYETGVILTIATVFGIYFMMKSRIGMALRVVGDDEYASATLEIGR